MDSVRDLTDRDLLPILEKLLRDSNAESVFLFHRSGARVAGVGIDTVGLETLVLAGQTEEETHEFELEERLCSAQRIADGLLFVVYADKASLGIVRLRMRKAAAAIEALLQRGSFSGGGTPGGSSGGEGPGLQPRVSDERSN